MFVWVRGSARLDAERLYQRTVARGVAFVPGKFFYVHHEDGAATLRMNFTAADPETIDRAVAVIAEAIAEELADANGTAPSCASPTPALPRPPRRP